MSELQTRLKHRSSFDFYAIRDDDDPFVSAAEVVADWVAQKESCYDGSPIAEDVSARGPFPLMWDYRMPAQYHGGKYYKDRWPALACVCVKDDEGVVTRWIVEYDEPDAHADDRRWHTTACIDRCEQEHCHVWLESTCYQLSPDSDPLPETIAAPSLVRSLIDLPWHVAKIGPTQLQTVPNKLSVQTFEHFAAALTDPDRAIPLVLFCTGYDGKIPEQSKQLARRALGTANVYVVDWSNEELRDKVQALFERGTAAGEYACPRSSCRMYMPGIDLTDPHKSRTHESWNREALEAQLPSRFAESLARRFMPSQVTPCIADLGIEFDEWSDEPDTSMPEDGMAYDREPGRGSGDDDFGSWRDGGSYDEGDADDYDNDRPAFGNGRGRRERRWDEDEFSRTRDEWDDDRRGRASRGWNDYEREGDRSWRDDHGRDDDWRGGRRDAWRADDWRGDRRDERFDRRDWRDDRRGDERDWRRGDDRWDEDDRRDDDWDDRPRSTRAQRRGVAGASGARRRDW